MNTRTYDKKDALSLAGLICGIIGCVSMCAVVPSIFFGALALFFALLSRGNDKLFAAKSRAAAILGIISIIAGVVIFFISLHSFIAEYGSIENAIAEFMTIYNDTYEKVYNSMY